MTKDRHFLGGVLRKTLIGVIPAFLITLSASAVSGPNQFHRYLESNHMPMMKEQLSLSQAQVDKIKAIYQAAAEKDKDKHADYQRLRDEFISTPPSDPSYNEKAQQLAEQASERIKTGVLSMADARQQVYAVLTPTQQKQFMASDAYSMPMQMKMQNLYPRTRNPHYRNIRGPQEQEQP